MGHDFGLAVAHEHNQVVVWISGDVDLASRTRLGEEVARQLADHDAVVVDLSQVAFIDSSGLGELVRCRQVAKKHGHRFYVRGATGRVAHVLEVTGLGSAFAEPAGAGDDA